MSKFILEQIQKASKEGKKLLAILLDPDKIEISAIESICLRIEKLKANFIFVGGSTVSNGQTDVLVKKLKQYITKPILLFPGDYTQITNKADALLFLSLISGQNPEYLINQQIKAVPLLQKSSLEIIPTGYVLIDGGTKSSVLKVSKTTPILQQNIKQAVATSLAGQYKGKKLIYLEAGSGAKIPVNCKLIKEVKNQLQIPLIVGGGIKTKKQLEKTYNCGADLVVIGTAFENNLI